MRTRFVRSRPITLTRSNAALSSDPVGARPKGPSGNSTEESSVLRQDEQEIKEVALFISDFEIWLSSQFHLTFIAGSSGTPDAAELTSSLLPWVNELADLGNNGILRNIEGAQAAKLAYLINHALDGLDQEYRRCGASPAVMMLALSPVEDILVFLSLVQRSTPQSSTDRTF